MHPDAAGHARPTITLTRDEEAYLLEVRFDLGDLSLERRQTSLAAASSLARSLVGRGAVPKIRWRYFTDRELNVGVGKSREDLFEENGLSGSAILEHPTFMPFLRYWIYGPDLPSDVISWFFVAVAQHADVRSLARSIRRIVREREMHREQAGEEFFKLALEAGLDIESAWYLRTAVRTVRRPSARPQPVER